MKKNFSTRKILYSIMPMKIAILGDQSTGKSTWMRKIVHGVFLPMYLPTTTIEVNFMKSQDSMIIETIECGHSWIIDNPTFLSDTEIDGAVIFIDIDSENIDSVISKWKKLFNTFCPGKPCLVVSSKSDLHRDIKTINGVDIILSSKTNTNIHTPLIHLIWSIKFQDLKKNNTHSSFLFTL